MSGKCLKILLLVTLIPLALRASSSLLLGGHGGGPPATSQYQSWHVGRRRAAGATGLSVSAASSVHKVYARRLRRVDIDGDSGDWFEDDKRVAPTGSNPLHNLRR
ncbi:hypothetical protein EJB05_31251, partial [Eragrostis curvula]